MVCCEKKAKVKDRSAKTMFQFTSQEVENFR